MVPVVVVVESVVSSYAKIQFRIIAAAAAVVGIIEIPLC